MCRAAIGALVIIALAGCATSRLPLLDEVERTGTRADAATDQPTPPRAVPVRQGLPDRMAEIREERRRARFATTETSSTPLDPSSPVTETMPDVGAPANVGAAPAPDPTPLRRPLTTEASGRPYALRTDDELPPVATSSDGQPAYPLDDAALDRIGQGARRSTLVEPGPQAALADAMELAPPAATGLTDAPTPPAPVTTTALPDTRTAYVDNPDAVLASLNAYRAQNGLSPLAYDLVLSVAARDHARDMAARGVVASTGAAGQGVLDRVQAHGGAAISAASLVAGGYADAFSAIESWRTDEAQAERLLAPEATSLGLALFEDRRSRYRYYVEAIIATEAE